MMGTVRVILAGILFLAGILTIATAIFGVFRFRFVLNRMHAAAIIDSLGLLLIVAGLMVLSWDIAYIPKLALILAFQWIGSPIASHMVARLEVHTDRELERHLADHRDAGEGEGEGKA